MARRQHGYDRLARGQAGDHPLPPDHADALRCLRRTPGRRPLSPGPGQPGGRHPRHRPRAPRLTLITPETIAQLGRHGWISLGLANAAAAAVNGATPGACAALERLERRTETG